MNTNFVVAPVCKYFFSLELSKVEVFITHPDPNANSDFRYSWNFDNYRLTESAINPFAPKWFEPKRIVYETYYPHLLVGKVCSISVYGKGQFVGAATLDLLTIATGPSNICLTLFQCDCNIGRMVLKLTCSEVCSTVVSSLALSLTNLRGPLQNIEKSKLRIAVRKVNPHAPVDETSEPLESNAPHEEPTSLSAYRHRRETVVSDGVPRVSSDAVAFDIEPHTISLDSEALFGGQGLRYYLFQGHDLVGYADMRFCDHFMTPEESLRKRSSLVAKSRSLVLQTSVPDSSGVETSAHEDSSDVRVLPPLDNVGKHTTERQLSFNIPIHQTGGAKMELCTLTASISCDRTITFAQMKDGYTYDGWVFGKPTHGFVRPPFVNGETVLDEPRAIANSIGGEDQV